MYLVLAIPEALLEDLTRNILSVMLCGWEGNRRSGVALVTHHSAFFIKL